MKKFVELFVLMSLSLIVHAQEACVPVSQGLTLNCMTLKANPGTATSTPGLSVYCKQANLSKQNAFAWGITKALDTNGPTAATCFIGTSSVTFKTVGGLYAGTTYWYFTGMSEATAIDLGTAYLIGLSTMTKGLAGGLDVFSNLITTGTPPTCMIPTTGYFNILGVLMNVYVQPPARTITWENNASSVTIKSTGGLYPGTSNYNIQNFTSLSAFVPYLNAIATTTIGVEGGIQAQYLVANATYVSTGLLDITAATNINGIPHTLIIGVTPTTSTVSYGVFGSTGMQFKSTGGLWPGTTYFPFVATNSNTMDNLISRLNNLPTNGVQGIGAGISAARVNGYYSSTTTLLLSNIAYTNCSGAITTLTAGQSCGISYILPGSALNIGQRYHLSSVVGRLTFESGSPTFKVYDGSSTNNTVIDNEVPAATGVDKVLNLPSSIGSFVITPTRDMRIDLINTSTVSAATVNINYWKGYDNIR